MDQDKIELGYAYKYNSATNNRTGTRRQPTIGQVQIGVAYGPSDTLTGTYDGSDRYTDPGIANVRNGTTYQFNSLTNNRTGNVTEPTTGTVKIGTTYGTLLSLTGTYDGSDRYTDPGIANVRNGTTYQFNSLTNNRTGNVVEPVASTVLSGVTYGTLSSLTGTLVAPDAATIAAAVLAAAATTPIQSDIRNVNIVTGKHPVAGGGIIRGTLSFVYCDNF